MNGANGNNAAAANNADPAANIEPYKLNEIFSIIPEYDGNQIFLNTFIQSCNTAFNMAVGNQKTLLNLHIKNKLRGRAAELINSRNPSTWPEIKILLENHFGDSRDLSSLIQDLQRIRQMPNESPLTFITRLQTHEAKMYASVNKQAFTQAEKDAQTKIIETMTLNTLLTGLEPKIGQIVRASDPADILTATNRIRRELQLTYFETQKMNNTNRNPIPPRKPMANLPPKQCHICKRPGHIANECRQRQFQQHGYGQNHQTPTRPPFQPQNFQPRFQQNFQANPNNRNDRPSVIQQNPNTNIRPTVVQPNPNLRNQQNRTYHFNCEQETNYRDQYEPYPYNSSETYPNYSQQYCTSQDNTDYPNNSYDTYGQADQDFREDTTFPTDPPNNSLEISEIQAQLQTIQLDDYNPNLNFPEQNFM